MVLFVASQKGMVFLEQHYCLNIYLITRNGHSHSLKCGLIDYPPKTIKVYLPGETDKQKEKPYDEKGRAEKSRDEIPQVKQAPS